MARSSEFEEVRRRIRGHRANDAAGHEEAEGVDRIGRVGHHHHVARRGDRLRHVGEAFLGAQRGDDLGLRIELHAEAALVIGGLGAPQPRNAAGRRIAVGAGLADGLLQLLDHMLGRRQVRIAHAEVDDVGSRIAGGRLGAVDLLEDVRGQTADAVKFFHLNGSSAGEPVRRRRRREPFITGCGRRQLSDWWSCRLPMCRCRRRAGRGRHIGVAAVAIARRDQVVLELLLLIVTEGRSAARRRHVVNRRVGRRRHRPRRGVLRQAADRGRHMVGDQGTRAAGHEALAHATSPAATMRRRVGRCDRDEFIKPSDQFPGTESSVQLPPVW